MATPKKWDPSNPTYDKDHINDCLCGRCCPCWFADECNCRCGETCAFFGAFFFVAATGFWLFGTKVVSGGVEFGGLNGLWWYHDLNFLFFYLAFALMICGPVYAVCARGKHAFSREADLEPGKEESAPKNHGEETAPIPYVMLSA